MVPVHVSAASMVVVGTHADVPRHCSAGGVIWLTMSNRAAAANRAGVEMWQIRQGSDLAERDMEIKQKL